MESQRCLRGRPGKCKCTVCRDLCALPGFHINEKIITLPESCSACHLCTAGCPEGAIRGLLPPSRLLNQVEIVLQCEKAYQEEATTIACIGAIPQDFLEVAAARNRSLRLITGPCEKCDLKSGMTIFEERIAIILKDHSLEWHHSQQPFHEIPERRQMLGWLKQSVSPNRMGASDYRELLSEERNSGTDTDQIRPVLTDQCVACPVCEVVCPHNVFHREPSDSGVRYQVVDSRCTGCNKCLDSCLFQGVILETTSNPGVQMFEFGEQNCPVCNNVFNGHQVSACPRCKMTETRKTKA